MGDSTERIQLLTTARDSAEAQLICMELAEAGIPASVQGETLAFGRGDLPMTPQTLPQVWVRGTDFDAARAIAEAFFSAGQAARLAPPGDPWRCAGCGEEIEEQFAACWNCGMFRTGAEGDDPGASTSLD